MILGSAGRVSALAASSSDMPFLNALMPCATSPISSEILPRPNSSRTTAITTIQCQILNETIEKYYAPSGGPPLLGLARTYEQGAAKTRTAWRPDAADRIMAKTFKSRDLRRIRLFLEALRRRRQAKVEIARLKRVLVVAQRRIVGRHRHRETRRQAVVEQP